MMLKRSVAVHSSFADILRRHETLKLTKIVSSYRAIWGLYSQCKLILLFLKGMKTLGSYITPPSLLYHYGV